MNIAMQIDRCEDLGRSWKRNQQATHPTNVLLYDYRAATITK